MRRHAIAAAAAMVLVLVPVAGGALAGASRADLVRLHGDSDEAILLAQAMKDWLQADLGSQRVFQVVRYVTVQDWVRDGGVEALDARQRRIYRDPSRYDRPLVQVLSVTAPKSRERPAEALLVWDLPLHLWEDLTREVSGLAADLARTFAVSEQRPIRIMMRFGDAEVLRLAASPEGRASTIFSYR